MLPNLFAAAFLLALVGCATTGEPLPPAPTTAEIVQMAQAGAPPAEIIQRM